jgi:hypothetical protein
MRKMNCRSVRREIEEVAAGELLSSSANDHMKNCAQCGTFCEERLKLREMLSSLGGVEAPGDFDFRLRARLANERRAGHQPFVMRNLSFGFRSAAVAAILLLIGSALLFVSLRTPSNSSLSANATKPPSTAIDQSPNDGPQGSATNLPIAANVVPKTDPSDVAEVRPIPPDTQEKVTTKRRSGFRRAEVASVRGDAGPNGRLKTRDLSSTQARVLRPRDAMAATGSPVFPIGTSFQSMKVSLDDGRGRSRTISLPSVSFGSQRVLAQGPSPLLASARSDW